MSFIIGKDGTAAIKSEIIDAIHIANWLDGYCVTVSFNEQNIPLTIFNSGNADDDYAMAKAYLAELVKKLNEDSEIEPLGDDDYI